MTEQFFAEQALLNFPFQPTDEQSEAIHSLSRFLFSPVSDSIFLLKGYAGTGKSSLTGAVVRTMNSLKQKAILLAPTGRAAKVFSSYAGQAAFTIHKKIYRQRTFADAARGFAPAENMHRHTLFIVDEASMLANDSFDSAFGSGRLLDDLIHYVYSGEGCRLLLLGDTAQLPPVGQSESPALNPDILKGYGLEVTEMTLRHVVRQAAESGILTNATMLRQLLDAGRINAFPRLQTAHFADMQTITGADLIERLDECYRHDGTDETIIITRSNRRANIFNRGVRNSVLWREEELSNGDLLLVAKNNYHWTEKNEQIDFIANGDIIEIRRLGRSQDFYGFRFRDVTARFPDYDVELDVKIILDTLDADSPALPREASDRLFCSIMEDYADLPTKSERMKRLRADGFYNALQVKFAYAVTCHKAQGGQWKNVFLDLANVPDEHLGIDFYRWLYTAFTRATERIFLVNPAEKLLG
jgi:exodeoxyribonuclease-5